ncbi:MAG: hypothetical protein HC794_08830 [Nitrospiraceae bacterium]|nr:hypothetical protein [Nitrospiraceae bacterium]
MLCGLAACASDESAPAHSATGIAPYTLEQDVARFRAVEVGLTDLERVEIIYAIAQARVADTLAVVSAVQD